MELLGLVGVLVAYCLLSWWILDRFYGRTGRLDLDTLFHITDVGFLLLAIHISHLDPAWVLALLLAKVGDQSNTSFARAFLLTHVTTAGYLLLIVVESRVEGAVVSWPRVSLTASLLYTVGFYISLTARIAEGMRGRARAAIRLARDSLLQLDARHHELRHQTDRLKEDLRAAADIQQSLLPRNLELPGLTLAYRFKPCERVGGDVLNLLPLGDRRVAVYVVDVSGHGVPAAMIATAVFRALTALAGSGANGASGDVPARSPAEVFRLLDEEFPVERFGKHFTISYLVLDTAVGVARYSSAAHPPPLFVPKNGAIRSLDAGGPMIGLGGLLPHEEEELFLSPGDRVLLYTDGLLERPSPSAEPFGRVRLRAEVERWRHLPLDDLCGRVMDAVERHGGGDPPPDDLTVLAVERREVARDRPSARTSAVHPST